MDENVLNDILEAAGARADAVLAALAKHGIHRISKVKHAPETTGPDTEATESTSAVEGAEAEA